MNRSKSNQKRSLVSSFIANVAIVFFIWPFVAYSIVRLLWYLWPCMVFHGLVLSFTVLCGNYGFVGPFCTCVVMH